MKTIIKDFLMVVGLCWCVVPSFCGRIYAQEYTIQDSIKYGKQIEAAQIQLMQERWIADHNGCLRIRSIKDGYALVEKYGLENVLQDSVLKVLGEPNRVVIDTFYVNGSSDKYIKLWYYCYSRCGIPTDVEEYVVRPESWFMVILSYRGLSYTQNRVVEVSAAEE